jgi:hypothetical protein
MEILGYYLPKERTFSENEVQEAYLSSASKNSKDLKKDKSAATLFREFQERPKDKKDGKPRRYDIFTWSQSEGPTGQTEDCPRKASADMGVHKSCRKRSSDTMHVFTQGEPCSCQEKIGFVSGEPIEPKVEKGAIADTPFSVFAGKKYKPVGIKVHPLYTELPEQYRIKRKITGDPLAELPTLNPNPGDFVPTGVTWQNAKR